ncbi:MAG: hypothetical protein K2X87_24585 [Gemmataceae bacterium]|nr:hypothetical protein [Gemmataceae bacterium]
MRVLLDECVPKRLGRLLAGHAVDSVGGMGWSGKKNGALLALMTTAGFEVLLTVDKGLRHQQNLTTAGVAMVLMRSKSNKLAALTPLVPAVLAVLAGPINPGDVIEVR